jgi:hypothetical protein
MGNMGGGMYNNNQSMGSAAPASGNTGSKYGGFGSEDLNKFGYNDSDKFGNNAYDPYTKNQSISTHGTKKEEKKKPA